MNGRAGSSIGTAPVAVLGAGLSGLAASLELERAGVRTEVYERRTDVGGTAGTLEAHGFLFDHGPHVSFTKRDEIRALFADAVGGDFLEHEADILNWWAGRWIPHPAQLHLHGLPADVVEDCIVDLVESQKDPTTADGPFATYADWCRRKQGAGFARNFTDRYTRKYWTAEPEQLTADWVGARVLAPAVRDVVRGALSPVRSRQNYLTRFRYPRRGGYRSFVEGVHRGQAVHLGCEVTGIDLRARRLELADGRNASFEALVSSLPLPVLVSLVREVPPAVREAAARLVCTSVVIVNVGLRSPEGLPDGHWLYFYDEDVSFSRVNFPHRMSPGNAPQGHASVQAEIYHSRYRPLPDGDVLSRALDDMRRVGLVPRGADVLFAEVDRLEYANVLFDHARAAARATVHAFLAEHGVECCGRYGEWAYLWTDDSVVSGREAGRRVAARLGRPAPAVP